MKKRDLTVILLLGAAIIIILNVIIGIWCHPLVSLICIAVSMFFYAFMLLACDKMYKLAQSRNREAADDIGSIAVDVIKDDSNKDSFSKVVICYIIVDNYSDVISGISGNEAGKLAVETEELMSELAAKAEGVMHKLDRDRFVMVFNMYNLNKLMADKFPVLTDIKSLRGTNGIPVTVSMGVGFSEESVEKTAVSAKAAMELALSRGGDQAVVKLGDEFRFFGGSTKETEKKTKVRARVMAQAICEIIRNSGQVLVMGHRNPDADSFGAAVGIYRIAENLGVRARIVIDGNNTAVCRELKRFKEVDGFGFAFVDTDKALEIINEKTLIVVVDTHSPERCMVPGLLNLTSKVVVIDHHRRSADFIKNTILTYHEPSASSTCEMITEILQYADSYGKISGIEAEALLAGVFLDTGSFTGRTGARTFDAAAYLKKCGADIERVRELFKTDINAYKKRCTIINAAKVYREITVISVSGTDDTEMCALAADELLLNIDGIKASFVISEGDFGVHISARSNGKVNVQIIAEMLGGGGHMTVAGVQLECPADEACDKLKNAIDRYFAEFY